MRLSALSCLFCMILGLAVLFVFAGSGLDFDYVIPKRMTKLATIVIGGICVAIASIIFQTLAGNRILTPAIMGYEAIYLLWQALLLLIAGAHGIAALGIAGNFVVSALLILGYSWLIQRWVLRNSSNDIYQMLLLGFVLTMVIMTFAQFVQLRISPGEFSIFQGFSYASFDRAQPETLLYSTLIVLGVLLFLWPNLPTLDVIPLGRDQAISFGIDYSRCLNKYFALIALLVAISTSLIGPTAFMGIFVANIAYTLSRSSQHKTILIWGCAIAIVMFLIAQLLVEHAFNYKTTVSILVNMLCGGYFLIATMRLRSHL